MTINQIKAKLGVSSLPLKACFDKDKNKTEWLRYWNNEGRFQVCIPREDAKKIAGNEDTLDFVFLEEDKVAEKSGKDYVSYLCFIDKDVEIVA